MTTLSYAPSIFTQRVEVMLATLCDEIKFNVKALQAQRDALWEAKLKAHARHEEVRDIAETALKKRLDVIEGYGPRSEEARDIALNKYEEAIAPTAKIAAEASHQWSVVHLALQDKIEVIAKDGYTAIQAAAKRLVKNGHMPPNPNYGGYGWVLNTDPKDIVVEENEHGFYITNRN